MTRDDLDAFRPLANKLRELRRTCQPFHADYDAVSVSLAAMDEMAEEILGEPSFYGAHRDSVGMIRR